MRDEPLAAVEVAAADDATAFAVQELLTTRCAIAPADRTTREPDEPGVRLRFEVPSTPAPHRNGKTPSARRKDHMQVQGGAPHRPRSAKSPRGCLPNPSPAESPSHLRSHSLVDPDA
ncbi:DUF6207 family protein [Streptomyces sp. NY05-11A]|uniref:DUF6207 family protein n=1 Tax=Streptomyces soliscabiei TaxID=588897 RepID=UPI0029AB4484|nr:DUF6207 family protein [Streptomyces sp. NY05-11A]MDX2683770.1 DUF6207 family protein [Streptomyces sp. NY05-11A]